MNKNYPIFEKWSKTLNWILDTIEKFPKSVRFSFSTRIANMTFDILECIIEAIYTKKREPLLSS